MKIFFWKDDRIILRGSYGLAKKIKETIDRIIGSGIAVINPTVFFDKAKKEPSSTYSRGSNIPTPKKKPPMPPVKSPKKNK